jgi:4-hydroxybenzoyl-CoA thioesterase
LQVAVTYLTARRQIVVEWGHCDPAGIVFNSRYFQYFDWSTWLLFEQALGVPTFKFSTEFDVTMPIVDVRARFLAPAKFGDVIEIVSTVSEFRRSSFDVQHRIENEGRLAVTGQETRVWTGHDPLEPERLRAKPIPAEVIDRFRVSPGTGAAAP